MAWGAAYLDAKKLDGLIEWLKGREVRIGDFSPAMFDIANEMRADVLHEIDSGGAFFGHVWPALADATVERWGDHPMLKNAAAAKGSMLYDSIFPFSYPLSAGVYSPDPVVILMEHGREASSGILGKPQNSNKGKKTQAAATKHGWGKMPARDFLYISEARQDASIQAIMDFALGEGVYSTSEVA